MAEGKTGRRGNAIVEFTLVGIPMIFVLVSIFEIARGMWVYDSLAHAVREGTRFAIVNGRGCAKIPGCPVTIADVVQRIRETGVGLSPDQLEVTLRAIGPSAGGPVVLGTVTCSPLRACLSRSVQPGDRWPPDNANRPKVNAVAIQGTFPFRSAIAMFWPGAGRGMTFGTVRLPASSMEVIQF